MPSHLAEFITYLETEQNAAENTRLAYQSDLTQWLEFQAREGIADDDLTGEDIYAFLGSLKTRQRPNRPSAGERAPAIERRTQARKLTAIKTYYRFLERRSLLTNNPARQLKGARFKRLLPRPLRVGELEALLDDDMGDSEKFTGIRDKALWETIYSSGMRISEALSLDVRKFSADVMPDEIKVMGKGGKERVVYLGHAARQALVEYLPYRADTQYRTQKTTTALFINFKGEGLTRRGAYYLIKKRATALGLDDRITPHSLRHSFATDLLNEGANIRHVQEMLGHASVSTTQNYTQVAKERLFEIYRKAHPHGRK